MHYHVSRNGQTYGPYTLEDLQRYVASGNVLPTDLAKTDEMTDWLPVSQILAGSQSTPAAEFSSPGFSSPGFSSPSYSDPSYKPAVQGNPAVLAASPYPDAPNLHWGLVLLFSFLTCFLFTFIWDIVIAAWLKRVQPNAKALYWYLAALAIFIVRWILSIVMVGGMMRRGMLNPDHVTIGPGMMGFAALSSFLGLVMVVFIIVANFMKRASLEEHFNGPEPVGLRLSGVMTFFFAPWYFQYHLNKINAMKQAARFGAGRAF